ncbi:uncharacterized protein RCC_02034 [Ramularia collo-cygni]|uniref:Uncharacterized protein n=1 Tax=Ramularia collo-cygni TaxID=112498 RepID=A0A2D3UM80_9PEZI|nr:uncharacterized protein RCC_02034 [Ramularia collo-cygni]CZT16192.1 uncharacterized protein RCC_02034 [Ramularia collo-cygni]
MTTPQTAGTEKLECFRRGSPIRIEYSEDEIARLLETADILSMDMAENLLMTSENARRLVSRAFESGDEDGKLCRKASTCISHIERLLQKTQDAPFQKMEREDARSERHHAETIARASMVDVTRAVEVIRKFAQGRVLWKNMNKEPQAIMGASRQN